MLIEGFKTLELPKIELHRADHNTPFIHTNDTNIQAIACCNDTQLPTQLPRLDINNVPQIADFIIEYIQNWQPSIANLPLMQRTTDFNTTKILSLRQGLAKITSYVKPISEHEIIKTNEVNGRVLAQDVISPSADATLTTIGNTVIYARSQLRIPEQAILADLGFDSVPMFRRPKVAIFSTADQDTQPKKPLKVNYGYDSNHLAIASILTKLGCEIIDLGIINDSIDSLTEVLSQASAKADVVINSCGVSSQHARFIKPAFEKLGQLSPIHINIFPNQSLIFGQMSNSLFFGSPSNPVAIMISFMQLIQPALRKLAGEKAWSPRLICATTDCKTHRRTKYSECMLGICYLAQDGKLHVTKVERQGLESWSAIIKSNCIIVTDESLNIDNIVYIQIFDNIF